MYQAVEEKPLLGLTRKIFPIPGRFSAWDGGVFTIRKLNTVQRVRFPAIDFFTIALIYFVNLVEIKQL